MEGVEELGSETEGKSGGHIEAFLGEATENFSYGVGFMGSLNEPDWKTELVKCQKIEYASVDLEVIIW